MAEIRAIVGDDLLAQNFPLIHAVGRAAAASAAPRLIDMVWGDDKHPRVTLVGKGVCFDTGGLDIKPDSGMLNMKKDMGGAATALALAHMIMARGLKVRLRVLIPAVENSIAGASFRPRDIYTSRKGITVEIGNTDAEGRLILADALALADEEKPELIADFATLTGAARVALGPDMPAFFTDDDALADELMGCAASENDPLWRLPLWRPYEAMLESKVADINNVGGSQGGAITAASVHAPLRQRKILAAFRPVRLVGDRQAGPAGRRRLSGGARALRAARRPLRLSGQKDARLRSPPHAGTRRSGGEASRRQSESGALRRRPRLRSHRAAGAAAPRAAARRAARDRGAQGRARHRSTMRTGRAGRGVSSPPTVTSAGCRKTRWRRPARRRRTR